MTSTTARDAAASDSMVSGLRPYEPERDTASPNRNLTPVTTGVDSLGRLQVGGIALSELAQRYGTPLYVLDEATLRGTALAELDAMTPRFSQWLPGEEVPEKHWMYRLAKKYWFYDFGIYQHTDHAATLEAKERILASTVRAA